MSLTQILNQIIKYSFYLIFFLVPLILTPWNYELFEFNKMIAVYFLTTIILGAWLIKMVVQGEIRIQRTPLDIPIFFFLTSQFLSFLFSIDPHVSLWGYYSRFHGGLLSTICYLILYYAFVSNFGNGVIGRGRGRKPSLSALSERLNLFIPILASATLVSLYGILEHFGIDKDLWVQDVQNRVFSTLGQPNWLAAYLCVVLPITLAFALNSKQIQNSKYQIRKKKFRILDFGHWRLFRVSGFGFRVFTILALLFYICILYTKSRSGFLAFWLSNLVFITLILISLKPTISPRSKNLKSGNRGAIATKILWLNRFFQPQKIWQKLLILNLTFLLITFFTGSPFAKINRYLTFSSLVQKLTKRKPPPQPKEPALQTGGTESAEIRKIVWKGALQITRHFPLFGTGVETFAFSYYRFRPKEHNLTSEWDFLYNKAHNEYLNYAATTGLFGLGSYLLVIFTFVGWFLRSNSKSEYRNPKQIPNSNAQNSEQRKSGSFGFWISDLGFRILNVALFTGWLSILITNFFGFSVVLIALFFWLIPPILFVFSNSLNPKNSIKISLPTRKPSPHLAMLVILSVIGYLLSVIGKLWYADTLFARGNTLLQAGEETKAYPLLQKAVSLVPDEPLYHDKFSQTLAALSVSAFLENEATLSATLLSSALSHSQKAVTISPQNVNFWKGKTRIFYTLSQIDKKYLNQALESILVAHRLAPTDAKILYNLALLQAEAGKEEEAIKTLEKTIALKPNYRNARFALALFYQEKGLDKKAKEELKYILEKINPKDQEAKEQLEDWER